MVDNVLRPRPDGLCRKNIINHEIPSNSYINYYLILTRKMFMMVLTLIKSYCLPPFFLSRKTTIQSHSFKYPVAASIACWLDITSFPYFWSLCSLQQLLGKMKGKIKARSLHAILWHSKVWTKNAK